LCLDVLDQVRRLRRHPPPRTRRERRAPARRASARRLLSPNWPGHLNWHPGPVTIIFRKFAPFSRGRSTIRSWPGPTVMGCKCRRSRAPGHGTERVMRAVRVSSRSPVSPEASSGDGALRAGGRAPRRISATSTARPSRSTSRTSSEASSPAGTSREASSSFDARPATITSRWPSHANTERPVRAAPAGGWPPRRRYWWTASCPACP